jgi:hypothetical protein
MMRRRLAPRDAGSGRGMNGGEERYERWAPIHGLEPRMYLDAMHDDREGFRLILRSDGEPRRALRILFESPLCYRAAQEDRLLDQLYESHDIYPWPIFVVQNSRYTAWFFGQLDKAQGAVAHHYHIAAIDEVIDVISERPPVLCWIGGK